jgi:hypothetical protein
VLHDQGRTEVGGGGDRVGEHQVERVAVGQRLRIAERLLGGGDRAGRSDGGPVAADSDVDAGAGLDLGDERDQRRGLRRGLGDVQVGDDQRRVQRPADDEAV